MGLVSAFVVVRARALFSRVISTRSVNQQTTEAQTMIAKLHGAWQRHDDRE